MKEENRVEVKLLWVTPEPEKAIEIAYRNCWQSKLNEKTRSKFIQNRIKEGHLSPLEFAEATFEIVGSRVFTHQLVRHRMASYAQESQRYVQIKDPDYFVVPPKIADNPKALEIFEKAVKTCFEAYSELLELGIPKEDARYLLPNATKSKILVKMNFRAWRHFLKLRCEASAQWEIREIAEKILVILYHLAPSVFEDLYQKFILKLQVPLLTERD